ncbi:MAG: hypothetical protein IJN63_02085 [Clostridia bacterium]|nr:hypothetical protein [Clostridia bacterium]
MMREDDREILTVEKIRKDGMELSRFSLGTNVLGTVLFLGITALFIAITPMVFELGSVLLSVIWSAVVVLVVRTNVKVVLDTLREGNKWLMYRNYAFDVVEAAVSMKTERVERERHGSVRRGYTEYVNHHYMFFKDYGEMRCEESVKEGDTFYLEIRKKDKKIINAYSAIRYRFRG